MIRILSIKNGVGLSRDVKIIQDILNANGIKNEFQDVRSPTAKGKYGINIFVEILNYKHFASAHLNYLIPNPEWFYRQWMPLLTNLDKVICKTKDAKNIFDSWGCNTLLTGFTSDDRYQKTEKKKTYVHLPGKSSAKGTFQVIEAFSKPGMPLLTIYSQKDYPAKANNIILHKGIIEDKEYKRIQNENLIHICTSTYEGFGHYINEAKSTGSVIVTTNSPPMNELVNAGYGIGCNFSKESRVNLAIERTVSVDSICEMVNLIDKTPIEVLIDLGKKARESYLENDTQFKKLFIEAL